MGSNYYNPEIHQRHSTRLPDFDYASRGAYFVTICTIDRLPILKEEELHSILVDTWESLPLRFTGVALDEFVVMPDHVHFIVWLNADELNIDGKKGPTLGGVVGAFKSVTSVTWLKYVQANKLDCVARFWQRGYIEHVIRNDFELDQRRAYIRNNPIKEELRRESQGVPPQP